MAITRKQSHKFQFTASVLVGLAFGLAAPAYSASPHDSGTVVTSDTQQLQHWYGRAGGLTGSGRIENQSSSVIGNVPVEVVPSKVFNDFTHLPGRSTPGKIETGLSSARADHTATVAPYTGLAKSEKPGRASG